MLINQQPAHLSSLSASFTSPDARQSFQRRAAIFPGSQARLPLENAATCLSTKTSLRASSSDDCDQLLAAAYDADHSAAVPLDLSKAKSSSWGQENDGGSSAATAGLPRHDHLDGPASKVMRVAEDPLDLRLVKHRATTPLPGQQQQQAGGPADDDSVDDTDDNGAVSVEEAASTASGSTSSQIRQLMSSVSLNSNLYRCPGLGQCVYAGRAGSAEHVHCRLCPSDKVLLRREDTERHERWHARQSLWLQRGFLRFTASEHCLDAYPRCFYNGHQTHYHCLRPDCSRVYVNTYEMQQHAESHLKDTAIQLDGFRRFRATDVCGSAQCPYVAAHTTHFHCQRPGCGYAFKVKADMEKHKIYHQRDDDYMREGFRKFMKYQMCPFVQNGCNLSQVTNHIHCMRPGCHYVLHSSGQLQSHRRKHERDDEANAAKRLVALKAGTESNRVAVPQQKQRLVSLVPLLSASSSFQPAAARAPVPVDDQGGGPLSLLLKSAFKPVPTFVPADELSPLANSRADPVVENNNNDDDDDECTGPIRLPSPLFSRKRKLDGHMRSGAVGPAGSPGRALCLGSDSNSSSSSSNGLPQATDGAEDCGRGCIYAGRGVTHYHCPMAACSCAFTRLANLQAHLKVVHQPNSNNT